MRYPARVSGYRLAFVLLPLAVSARGSAQTVLLRFKPPVGASVRYTMTMSMNQKVPGMAVPMISTTTIPMTVRVVSRAAGTTTLETKMGKAKVTMPANSPMASMKDTIERAGSDVTSTTVVDELGNLKNVSLKGANPMMSNLGSSITQGAQGVSYPLKAVKVGDSWTMDFDMGKMMGKAGMGMGMTATGKVPIVYRLVSVDKRGGKTLAKILISMKGKSTMTMAARGQKVDFNMNVSGSTVVDTGTGLAVNVTMTSDSDMKVRDQTMHQHMVMSMKSL